MGTTFENSGPQHAGRDINMVGGNMVVGAPSHDAMQPPPAAAESQAEAPAGARVFVSYRRDDTAGEAGRLHDSLTARLGPGSVFVDVEAIEGGDRFGLVLRRAIVRSDVVLVLMGPRWASDRLLDPDDWVRREIELALEAGVPIVPVLVRGSRMVPRSDLPETIASLADFHAVSVGEDWQAGVDRLAANIRRHLDLRLDVARGAPPGR